MPNVNCSWRRVAPIEPPNFTLWFPRVIATSAFAPMFMSVRSWLTVAGVSLSGFDVEGVDVLVLRLLALIERVGHVETRLCGLNVEVQCVGAVRAKVETIEQRDVVPRVVKRLELRRIEEPIRAQP